MPVVQMQNIYAVTRNGNIMPLIVLLMLMAYLLFRVDPDRNLVVSGLLLSLAVGWRSFPILLLPFFLASLDQTVKKIRFTACVVAPVALSMIPFLWVDARPMLHEVFSYSGWGIHHGPFGVLRGLHLLSIGRVTWENPSEWTPWMSASKLVFLALYGFAVFFSKRMAHILFGALDVPRVDAVPLLRHYVISQSLFSAVCAAGIVVFGTGIAATHPAPRMEEVGPARWTQRLGVLGQLVCLYYLVLFVWEIAFVSALK